MGVRLRPLREDEFEDWLSRSREGYAREMVENGGFPEPEAREKARGDFAGLLGDGLETPGHAVFALEDDSSGEHVGDFWLAELCAELAFFDEYVVEGHRGTGYGPSRILLA